MQRLDTSRIRLSDRLYVRKKQTLIYFKKLRDTGWCSRGLHRSLATSSGRQRAPCDAFDAVDRHALLMWSSSSRPHQIFVSHRFVWFWHLEAPFPARDYWCCDPFPQPDMSAERMTKFPAGLLLARRFCSGLRFSSARFFTSRPAVESRRFARVVFGALPQPPDCYRFPPKAELHTLIALFARFSIAIYGS